MPAERHPRWRRWLAIAVLILLYALAGGQDRATAYPTLEPIDHAKGAR